MAEFARGRRSPGLATSGAPSVRARWGARCALPSNDFIFFFFRRVGRGCHVPGVQPGALRWETHLDTTLVARGRSDSAWKGQRVREGKSRWLKGSFSSEITGLKGLPSGALPSSIPSRTEAKVLGQLHNSQGGCCCGPSGCRGRAFPGPWTPRGSIPRLCPAAPGALPAVWRWQCSPLPTGHPLRDRGDHRPSPARVADRHSSRSRPQAPPSTPRSWRNAGRTFHGFLHHLVVAIHGGCDPAQHPAVRPVPVPPGARGS